MDEVMEKQQVNIVVHTLLMNLSRVLYEDVKLMGGGASEFQRLLNLVRRLNACLLYDPDPRLYSQLFRNSLPANDILSAAYKIEDVIDELLLLGKLCYNKFLFSDRRRKRVENLSMEMEGILEQMTEPPANIPLALPSSHKSILMRPVLCDDNPNKGLDLLQEPHDYTDYNLVGFDEDVNAVIWRLLQGSDGQEIVSIVGMPGIGKTTVAKIIYNDSRISGAFSVRVWINAQLNQNDIYLCFLRELNKIRVVTKDMDAPDLRERVHRWFLGQSGRYLIVLDSVQTMEVVDLLRELLPINSAGHRILLTTRSKDVACYTGRGPHLLGVRNEEESFQLFTMCVFGRQGGCPHELVELGQRIVSRCGGIPLLLSIVARSLKHHTNAEYWLNYVHACTALTPINYYDSTVGIEGLLFARYNNLPCEMQACFLYFSMFPPGFEIPVWKLIRMWIADGLITISDSDSDSSSYLEVRAESCLNSLADMNLVMVMQRSSDGRIKTCRFHGLMQAFCVSLAEKWFSQQVSVYDIDTPVTARRLCIESSALNDFLTRNPTKTNVRSLYCLSSEQTLSDTSIQLIPQVFPMIRVLFIQPPNFVFSQKFNHLFHLRYIDVSGNFNLLPKPIGKFWNLQTLKLHTTTSNPALDIKANIWKLLRLRHLHTNIPAKLPPPPKPMDKESCLQTLSVVAPESCSRHVFTKACNLKKLGIQGNLKDFLETGLSNLEELKYLQHLKLHNKGAPTCRLHLPQSFFRFLHMLKMLTLRNTYFDWSEANMLGQLGSLEVLKLKEFAFKGRLWKAGRGRFSHLQVLWIEKADLEFWDTTKLHFPRLMHLVLVACPGLEAVPYELAHVPSFQEMRLTNTGRALESAKKIKSKKLESMAFKLTIEAM